MNKLHEECGVFGVWNHTNAAHLTYFGLHSLQHRGQESAGIVTSDQGSFYSCRELGLVTEIFKDSYKLDQLKGNKSIGHVRYATEGENSIRNVQPFLVEFYNTSMSICHNGNLINAKSLRIELENEGAIFQSSSDTEVLIHLIRKSKQETFKEQLKESLRRIKGGFTYLILTEEALYGAVDPNGLRPLVIGKTQDGAYIMASETCAIENVGASFVQNIYAGELAIITDDGIHVEKYIDEAQVSIVAMEYIYFARPDSNIAGINVHTARKNTGKQLAIEAPVPNADIVIGVPNSSLSAATGYSEQSGLPYEMGLIKNQYSNRTFIQPTQSLREQGVRMKLSAVKGVVQGKRVVLVDDSVVRGTTSRRIVRMLKEAGALEVHLRVASPPLMFPSFYGIDISKSVELIAANKTISEICEEIGADSLQYLSEDGLVQAIGLQDHKLCLDCFTGDYVAGLYDYKEGFINGLTSIQEEFLQSRGLLDHIKRMES